MELNMKLTLGNQVVSKSVSKTNKANKQNIAFKGQGRDLARNPLVLTGLAGFTIATPIIIATNSPNYVRGSFDLTRNTDSEEVVITNINGNPNVTKSLPQISGKETDHTDILNKRIALRSDAETVCNTMFHGAYALEAGPIQSPGNGKITQSFYCTKKPAEGVVRVTRDPARDLVANQELKSSGYNSALRQESQNIVPGSQSINKEKAALLKDGENACSLIFDGSNSVKVGSPEVDPYGLITQQFICIR